LEYFYERLAPTMEEMTNILKTYNYFHSIVKEVMTKEGYQFDLVIYGSTANGLSIRGDSDLDLSLVIHNFPESVDGKDKAALTKLILEKVAMHIRLSSKYSEQFNVGDLLTSSFGYLQKFKDRTYGVDIDLLVNKVIDPYNSHLIQNYAKLDSRFHKLALILKFWNKTRFSDQ